MSFSRRGHALRAGYPQRGPENVKSRSADSEYSVRTLMPSLPKHGVHMYTDNMGCIEEERNTPRKTALSFRTLHSGYKLIGTALTTLRRTGKVTDASLIHKTDSDDNLIISQLSQRESALKRYSEEKWRMKSTSNTIYTLAPFIPRLLQDTLKELDPMFPDTVRSEREAYNAVASAMRPSMATFCGAVMVADVTGFTMLTEKLSKRGTNGVEILTKCINNFFSKVIEVVFEYQGDVIKFAGDSLIVAFYPSDKELSVSSNEGLTEATIRSVKCACRLSKTLGHVLMVPNGDVIPLSQAENKGWAKQKLFLNAARAFKMAGNRRDASFKEEEERHQFHQRKSAVQTLKSMMTPSERSKTPEDAFPHLDLGSMNLTRSCDPNLRNASCERGDDSSSGKHVEGNASSRVSGTEKSSTADSLSLKVLVGSGTVCIFRVGGHEEQSRDRVSGIKRWEFFIGDEPHSEPGLDGTVQPLRQIAEIEHHAEAGDVIVSKEVVQAAGQHFRYEPLGDGASRIPLGEVIDGEAFQNIPLHDHTFHFLPPRARLQCAAIMRMHVLDNVRQRIEAGHVDFVNEIRRLSVLFMGFPGLSERSDTDGLESVQIAVKNVQQRMLEFDGSFLQFRCDEKGFLAICAFGLPGKSHVDNCARAVTSALKISQSMDEVGYRVVVGVTTGDLLCACVGSRTRAEYTVFGDAINLSARLMCKGKTGMGDILCDHATYERAKRKANFAPLEPLTVKGKEETVIVYRVLPLKVKQSRRSRALSSTARSRLHQPMIGRHDCVQTISEAISAVFEDGTGRAVVIEGEPGSGKTKLVHEMQRMKAGHRNEAQHYYGMGDAAFKSLPLFPWRRVFEDMFTHDRMASSSLQAAPRSDFVSLEENTEPTSLGHLLKAYIDDYEEEWRSLIANSLDLPPSLIPLAESTAHDARVDRSLVPRMYHLVSLAEFILVLRNPLSRSRSKDVWRRGSANLRRAFSDPVNLGPLLSPQRFHSIDERMFSSSTWNDTRNLRLQSGRKPSTYGGSRPVEEEAPIKAKMEVTKELRSQQLLEILVDVCRIFIQLYGPIIIFLEDIHHFDTMSWTLLNRLVEDSKVGCVVIATLRPNDGTLAPHTRHIQGKEMVHQKANDAFKQLKQAPNTTEIKLAGLDIEATRRLIALTAEDEKVSEEIVAAVWEKTEGLPMYIEQMSIYLRENSMLHIRSQAGSAINSDAGLADFIRTTVTIHHALIKQMDQLRPSSHLTLKVAAVLGANITIKKLRVLYPYSISPRSLDKSLVELEDTGFLKPSQDMVSDNKLWQFNSHMARDAIYELIPHFQRRALHAKLAALLNTLECKAPHAIIAYHWTQSCAGVEATEWRLAMCAMEEWEKATHEAMQKSAPAEALRLLQKAVDISNKIMAFYTQQEGDPGSMSMIVNSASSGHMSFESQSPPVIKRAQTRKTHGNIFAQRFMLWDSPLWREKTSSHRNRLLTPDEILEAKQVVEIMLQMPHVHGVRKQCVALLQYFNSCRHPLESEFLDLEQRSHLVWQTSRISITSLRSYK
ncbi:hypothetical protein BSKO_08862 [Bryopsis sp. KO-2023]|nr:hypothetical protein BSKO_08862 [Bryopsis sp. KO-2023]